MFKKFEPDLFLSACLLVSGYSKDYETKSLWRMHRLSLLVGLLLPVIPTAQQFWQQTGGGPSTAGYNWNKGFGGFDQRTTSAGYGGARTTSSSYGQGSSTGRSYGQQQPNGQYQGEESRSSSPYGHRSSSSTPSMLDWSASTDAQIVKQVLTIR